MTYRVHYSEGYMANLDKHLTYLRASGVSQFTVDRWFGKLFTLTEGLSEWPERFPVDRVLTEATGRETRKANYGRHLISYYVDSEQGRVTLLGFVHGATRRER